MKSPSLLVFLCFAFLSNTVAQDDCCSTAMARRWSAERAKAWYHKQPWLVGCNFIPNSAVNQLEMWQAATFDPVTIDRELGWAEAIGFNVIRVYLHDLAWQADPQGLKNRISQFLVIADKHRLRTLFVLFDDCWNPDPKIGKQPEPVPGVHNSGWLQSPGRAVVNDPGKWDRLERYVKDVLGSFQQDNRIIMWDLYNEPGNSDQGVKSLPLLKKTFLWARQTELSQPITAGVWCEMGLLNEFQLSQSDILTFHNYNDAKHLESQIQQMKKYDRPFICTEWMRRPISTVAEHLPIFKREKVGCIHWGLVSGKTQTIFPWGSKEGDPQPDPWFHDLLYADGRAYRPEEIKLLKTLIASNGPIF